MKLLTLLLSSISLAPSVFSGDRPTAHEERDVYGWSVRVDSRLLEGDKAAIGEAALALLRSRLADILVVVPAAKVAQLKKVPIWLDLSNGSLTSMQYHPSAKWLSENGFSPAMEKAVHIPVVSRFLDPRHQQTQPWCVLHELAHAYHDRVLGFEEPRVKAAWEKYVASGNGVMVLHVSGRHQPHYALTNHKEFFAEMTEAYFGVNDFVPFVHGQLKHEEPDVFKLLREIWGPSALD